MQDDFGTVRTGPPPARGHGLPLSAHRTARCWCRGGCRGGGRRGAGHATYPAGAAGDAQGTWRTMVGGLSGVRPTLWAPVHHAAPAVQALHQPAVPDPVRTPVRAGVCSCSYRKTCPSFWRGPRAPKNFLVSVTNCWCRVAGSQRGQGWWTGGSIRDQGRGPGIQPHESVRGEWQFPPAMDRVPNNGSWLHQASAADQFSESTVGLQEASCPLRAARCLASLRSS